MLTAVIAIAPLCIVGVLLTATSWWEALIILAGYLACLGMLRKWSLDGYPRAAVYACAFTGLMWLIGSLSANSPISFMPFALLGALLLARLRQRWLWITGFALGVTLIGATALFFHPITWSLVGLYLLLPFVGTLFIAGVLVISEQTWVLVRRVERAKEVEGDLAIARERARFAGDLHDIQGHSLHVIKLKATLAQRLIDRDPDRAAAELDEIRSLVDDTIARTRQLAYARYELNLSAEIENARRVCEAAGIVVDVRDEVMPGTSPHPLLAQVLREGTTNLLRHARPTSVSIVASTGHVEIVNDGVTDGEDTELHGLGRLRERVDAAGGALQIVRTPGRFGLRAELDPPTPARASLSEQGGEESKDD
ncbi:MAG: sensor histidine kinase [Actinomycetota bacterium]